jgi:16S rRNA G966 N2-methylase RsmD
MRNIRDLLRGAHYLFNYYILEKPRGLDFSLRDLSCISNSQQNGYAMTSDKAIRNIARKINFLNKSFLDIGSGKGRVVYQALKLGAKHAEGVEFSEKLHSIASKNFEILGVQKNCISNCIDAIKFNRYDEFDIYFLFNPFENDLYEEVIDCLMAQVVLNSRNRHIICYGGANLASIEKYSYVNKVYEGICPHRGNRVVIYSF